MKTLIESKLETKKRDYAEYLQRKSRGIMTGIRCLDNYLLGLGGTVSIQGETSSCKSSLGLQIVHHNLKKGMPSLLIDKENGDGRIIDRLLCQANKMSPLELKQAMTSNPELAAPVFNYPLHIHTEPIEKLEVLEARVKDMWLLYKRPFTVLFDSIQAADRVSDDQRVSLEQWVYFLDRLKVEFKGRLTVIMISEKNRMSYGQSGIGGGKGSNVVDYKPETILDLTWNEDTDTFDIKVSKHRDGMRGAAFELRKVLSQPTNNRSFTFLLEETETESELSGLDPEPENVLSIERKVCD